MTVRRKMTMSSVVRWEMLLQSWNRYVQSVEPLFKTTIYGTTCWIINRSTFQLSYSTSSLLSHVSTHSPNNVSADRLMMVGLKECSMKDEDYFQATMFDFQEVRIHTLITMDVYTLCTIILY